MAKKKALRKRKLSRAASSNAKKNAKKKVVKKKAAKKKVVAKARAKKPLRRKKPVRSSNPTSQPSVLPHATGRLRTGGQSGDTQGLSRSESANSESVEELVDEGQDYEAEVVSGVENALDPDQSEVTTLEVPEDDVPLEYTERDE